MDVNFEMSTRKKMVFIYLLASHAQKKILVISIDGLGQDMPLVKFHTVTPQICLTNNMENQSTKSREKNQFEASHF